MKIVYLKDVLNPDSYLELVSFYYDKYVGFRIQSQSYSESRIEDYDNEACGETIILAIEGLVSRLKYYSAKDEYSFRRYTKRYVNNIRIFD